MDAAEFVCKRLRMNQIWEVAEKVRAQHWPENTLPVDLETIVECRLKLDIDFIPGLLEATDMDACLKSDLTGIVVDLKCFTEDKFANRTRFSFAHELGHYFLHKYIYSNLSFESASSWKSFILTTPDTEYRSFEFQANEFAGRLLVPYEVLIKERDNALVILNENGLDDVLKEDPQIALSAMSPMMSKKFGVSSEVIEKRIIRENLWPPKVY